MNIDNKKTIISLIPARSGSKGIPGKNIANLNGKPLLTYTIEASQNSKMVEATYLSSDDSRILSLGESLNAIPIKRPSSLAEDNSDASSVVKHFAEMLPQEIKSQDPLIVYLQPTSPLRTSQHIDHAIEYMQEKKGSSLVSVKKLKHTPFKSLKIENGYVDSLFNEAYLTEQRQNLPQTYLLNGAIYIFSLNDFFLKNDFPIKGSLPYIMDDASSIDIDTKEDLIMVEKIIKGNHE